MFCVVCAHTCLTYYIPLCLTHCILFCPTSCIPFYITSSDHMLLISLSCSTSHIVMPKLIPSQLISHTTPSHPCLSPWAVCPQGWHQSNSSSLTVGWGRRTVHFFLSFHIHSTISVIVSIHLSPWSFLLLALSLNNPVHSFVYCTFSYLILSLLISSSASAIIPSSHFICLYL